MSEKPESRILNPQKEREDTAVRKFMASTEYESVKARILRLMQAKALEADLAPDGRVHQKEGIVTGIALVLDMFDSYHDRIKSGHG